MRGTVKEGRGRGSRDGHLWLLIATLEACAVCICLPGGRAQLLIAHRQQAVPPCGVLRIFAVQFLQKQSSLGA